MNWDYVLFLRLNPSTVFQTLIDYEGYSNSMGFLLTVVDIWSSELNSLIPIHFSSLIPKMLMITLAISCLTTSSLPWFMDLTFQVPMQYCSLQHRTLLSPPGTFTTLDHKEGWALEELMLSNCGTGKDSWESLGQQGDQTTQL